MSSFLSVEMASKLRDVVIVGGGVMGCSTAYHLAQKAAGRLRITVVERSFAYKRTSAVLSAGGIRMQFSEKPNIAMSQYGLEFLRNAKDNLSVLGCDPVDVNFVENGYLFLASAKGRETLKANHAVQTAIGAPVEIFSPDQLTDRFPWIDTTDVVAGALGLRDEGWFDPWAYLTGLKRKCSHLGVEFIEGELAGAMKVTDRAIHELAVRTTEGKTVELVPGHVVNASGAWAHNTAVAAGVHDLPIRARKRTVFVFQCPEAAKWTGKACSPLVVDPSGVYFRPEGCSGQFICGVSPDEADDKDCNGDDPLVPDYALFDDVIWPTIAARVPAFEAIKMVNAWAGFYDYNTFDHNAIIGLHPDRKNLYCINGFSGHGLQQSPAAGRGIAELIHDGSYTTLDLSAFSFDRIRNNQPFFEKNIV
ncbi:FAD-dependent oxidoreductase domain-containing protein [Achlya hypogyna]|uniref:FAD-dependent oxidoreductase domain-containing protein 1 n=1 Tax=Achlya hypogyna TaxID=1202772 RepID=A0A1V9YX68_ACHHY|nr:FAD-dependent oxidoreductase domain-containing protein [Achlya hypogyna]